MQTQAFRAFYAPATRYPQLWRLILGIVVSFLVYFGFILLLLGAVWLLAGQAALSGWMQRMAHAETPTSVLLMLATFIGMAAGPMVAARVLHKRSIMSLFGALPTVVRDFLIGAGLVALIFALSVIIWDPGYTVQPNIEMTLWLSFLPLAIVGVLVQTGAEEVLFRGYIQQQLAARFRAPIIWFVLPALMFGALHYDPATAGEAVWWLVAAATLFGLAAADLTRITGSIGAAWGFHFANNAFAILLVALDGAISGLALYKTPFTASDFEILQPLIVRDMIMTAIAWLILRTVLIWRRNKANA